MSHAPFERKNILVTGGAGFLGSHLCDVLVKDANVICVDNFATGNVKNIEQLLQNPAFEFINHDITQPLKLEDYKELERFHFNVQGIQQIYHLACPISKKQFEQHRISTMLTNSLGIKHVLDIAVTWKSKVLFASSAALYGQRREDHPYVNESDPCLIDHLTRFGAYDEGKRFTEAMLYTYADIYGLDVKIARIFRTYGPRMKILDGNLLPDIVNAALDNQEIELKELESTKIALCYVSDVIDGLVKHMNSPIDVTVMNLGSDQEYPLAQLAEKITRFVESTSHVHFVPDDQPHFEAGLPDLGRARQLLHWVPLVRLDDGLQKMIEFARSHRKQVPFLP
ncbi:NAD-dependent epimerase/dehydratase family protein [Patescibacteria group bacterium]|nr:NAD-dependent epimerase/dehydratase family protein [Patescibacteria group bacterium]